MPRHCPGIAVASLLVVFAVDCLTGGDWMTPRIAFAGPPVVLTDPLTPEEQQKQFILPPGFEIQLVAAEPEIQKPMNLQFDSRGRLWVTHSIEYPFAAADGEQARDGLTVLDGIGPDGRATKITRFADKLNIPIGVLPLPNGRDAIAWSIPNLWKLTDTDGDGRADKREILYGPFDFVDTHGNQNALRLGPDGWVYACHGFRNNSQVKLRGEGPVVLTMNSGNVYRFRPDGSAIELVAAGQVNPFGMCFDPRLDLFTADCHSRPITMLLAGGQYESFGKPHDGLGFAPNITADGHGSTGIGGVAWYGDKRFPPEFRDCFYVGNVVTNIVHRDRPQWRGSSPWIADVSNFVECKDQWFHPVDLQLGPDGALYISDFYNSIIGHYEVDLKHPRRDRTRGRIWRVVWKGTGDMLALPVPQPDLTKLGDDVLMAKLGDNNFSVRMLATHELIERDSAARPDKTDSSPEQQAHAIWLDFRLGSLDSVDPALYDAASPLVRVHLLKALGEIAEWHPCQFDFARKQLANADPFVRRAAAAAVARHPDIANVAPLLAAWTSAAPDDTQLIHTIRLSIRQQLRAASTLEQLDPAAFSAADLQRLAQIALAVPTESAAWFSFEFARRNSSDAGLLENCLTHAAQHTGPARLDEIVAFCREKFADDRQQQLVKFQSLLAGVQRRGGPLARDSRLGEWGSQLAADFFAANELPPPRWTNVPLAGAAVPSASPWGIRPRMCSDGQSIAVFDSIVGGEKLTGVLRSAPFAIPAKLTFWMCGHNGLPGTNPPPVNHIRLLLADSGEVIAKEIPPRNDTAQRYEWDLSRWSGQQGVIEIVDADTRESYAWLGVGRFEPAVVAQPVEGVLSAAPGLDLALQITEQLNLIELLPRVLPLIADSKLPAGARAVAAQTAWKLNPQTATTPLVAVLAAGNEPDGLRAKAAELLGAINSEPSRAALAAALATAPTGLQQSIAVALASTREGAESLLAAIAAGKASPRLLQEKTVLDRLQAANPPDREKRIAELTAGLPPADERLRTLIAARLASYSPDKASAATGAPLFKKHCAACHRVAGEGAMIGPQLDGMGQRGLERLLEDTLDPNRNVDGAFRTTIIETASGRVLSGLRLREEGPDLILADNQGKEFRVPRSEIESSRVSNLSLMPANFSDTLPAADLAHILAFLSQLKAAPPPPGR